MAYLSRLTCFVSISCTRSERNGARGTKLIEEKHYVWKWKRGQLAIRENVGAVIVKVAIDCRRLGFKAILDFDRLLRLADNADLEKLEDFASIEVYELDEQAFPSQGAQVTAEHLKGFVRRELRMDRRKGFVRNISSRGGFEQFLWSLSRCTPILYNTNSDGHI